MARSASLVAAIAVAAAAVLSSCSATNPITTTKDYSPSDGVSITLGDVTARNMLVVTAGAGETGALQGTVANSSDSEIAVTLTSGSHKVGVITVPANGAVQIGGDTGKTLEFTVPEPPGALTTIGAATGPGGSTSVAIPVLDGTLPEYATLVPTAG